MTAKSVRKNVLVIDDDPDVVRMLSALLESLDVDVTVAGDGLEGLERAAARTPDLVLVNFVMPRMNGIETIRALKADRALASVPVIMVTGSASARSVREAAMLGAADYLLKDNLLAGPGLGRIRKALGMEENPEGRTPRS